MMRNVLLTITVIGNSSSRGEHEIVSMCVTKLGSIRAVCSADIRDKTVRARVINSADTSDKHKLDLRYNYCRHA